MSLWSHAVCKPSPQHLPPQNVRYAFFPIPISVPRCLALVNFWPSSSYQNQKRPDTETKSQSVHPLARPPVHLALPKTNPWHRDPQEQVLCIFQLYNEAVDSFN